MTDLSSDSSDSEIEDEIGNKNPISGLMDETTLEEVNQCIREYDKETKRERKKRWDAGVKSLIVEPEDLHEILISKKEFKRLKPKVDRSAKQQAVSDRNMIDLRKNKESKRIILKMAPVVPRKAKPKVVTPPPPVQQEEEEEEEEEEEVVVVKKKSSKIQAKKPLLDDDEIESKIEKLSKLNNVIASTNPYLAIILQNRMRGRK